MTNRQWLCSSYFKLKGSSAHAAAGVGIIMFAWMLVLGFELEEMVRAIFWRA